MEVNMVSPQEDLPLERAYVVTMVIESFKGRRDVEVHLYRPDWDPQEEQLYDWTRILGTALEHMSQDEERSKQVIMEAFTPNERDELVNYLKQRYADRLKVINSAPLSFPVPQGLMPLSEMPEGENYGRIALSKVPNYPLSFPVQGFYDLSAHPPILQDEPD